MFRSGARAALRASQSSLAPARTAASRRFLTTEPPHLRSRSWKSSGLRWGIAIAGIYYYNTSPVFAEYPQNNLLNPNVDAIADDRENSTLDELTASSRRKAPKDASVLQSAIETSSEDEAGHKQAESVGGQAADLPTSGVEGAAELEQEAEGEGAFNPVTGEINWDCPCLGGMAYGPCGPEFREAFSCFVYSTQEPKGMDCIDKFQGMQNCFRAHPEHYKGELEDDEALDAELAQEREELQREVAERRAAVEGRQEQGQPQDENLLEEPAPTASASTTTEKKPVKKKTTTASKKTKSELQTEPSPQPEAKTKSHTPGEYSHEKETEYGVPSRTISQPKTRGTDAEAVPESEELVPKAAHDASSSSSRDSLSVAK